MSIIVIKDLAESIDLDRAAMAAITGGSRSSGRRLLPARTVFRSNSIVNFHYPAAFASNTHAPASQPSPGKKK